MNTFSISTDDLRADCMQPVAETMELLKRHIDNESALYEIDLALTEACANVARHAYPEEAERPMRIDVSLTPGQCVELVVTDRGRGLDPCLLGAGLPEATAEAGRGIPMMTDLCDEVRFECEGGENRVRLTKRIAAQFWRS